jgi:hypothetical protein
MFTEAFSTRSLDTVLYGWYFLVVSIFAQLLRCALEDCWKQVGDGNYHARQHGGKWLPYSGLINGFLTFLPHCNKPLGSHMPAWYAKSSCDACCPDVHPPKVERARIHEACCSFLEPSFDTRAQDAHVSGLFTSLKYSSPLLTLYLARHSQHGYSCVWSFQPSSPSVRFHEEMRRRASETQTAGFAIMGHVYKVEIQCTTVNRVYVYIDLYVRFILAHEGMLFLCMCSRIYFSSKARLLVSQMLA